HILIQPPAGGHMVYHDISDGVAADGVIPSAYVGFSAAEAHITDHHVVRIDPYGFPRHANTVSRRRLPGDGDVWRTHDQRRVQADDPRHVEHHDTRTALLAGFAQGTGTTIFQAGNHDHFPAPSAEAVFTAAFRAGETGNVRLRQVNGPRSPGNVRLSFLRIR